MNILDVLPIDPAERARRIREIKPVVIDTIDTICDTVNATKDAVADSVAQTPMILENGSGSQSDASLLLPMAIVTAALAGCFYLAHLYKRRLQAGNHGCR